MTNLDSILGELKKARDLAVKEVDRLDAALAALGGSSNRTGAGRLSAAARARIAAAQRARWAKIKAKNGKSNLVPMPTKRTLSPAARKKIAAAQRARWAKVKAAQKRSA